MGEKEAREREGERRRGEEIGSFALQQFDSSERDGRALGKATPLPHKPIIRELFEETSLLKGVPVWVEGAH